MAKKKKINWLYYNWILVSTLAGFGTWWISYLLKNGVWASLFFACAMSAVISNFYHILKKGVDK